MYSVPGAGDRIDAVLANEGEDAGSRLQVRGPRTNSHKKRTPPMIIMSRETEQQEEWAAVAPCCIDEKRQVDKGISDR